MGAESGNGGYGEGIPRPTLGIEEIGPHSIVIRALESDQLFAVSVNTGPDGVEISVEEQDKLPPKTTFA